MKRGEKILVTIGMSWTIGILVLWLGHLNRVGFDSLPVGNIPLTLLFLLVIWTVLGLIWVFVYGRRE